MPNRTCVVAGCEKPTRSSSADWCKMHYHRWYRHGDVERVLAGSGITASNGRKYVTEYLPSHSLAMRNGKVYVHRRVLFDKIGPGQHACHWCGAPVEWMVGEVQGTAGMLVVDHVDGHGDRNEPDNLVPSCGPCNAARGSAALAVTLRASGWWSHHDTKRP